MKKGIHPENYRPVVFKDMSNGDMFLTKSTAKTTETVEFEGETYPVVKVEIEQARRHRWTRRQVHEPLWQGRQEVREDERYIFRKKDCAWVVAYAQAHFFCPFIWS